MLQCKCKDNSAVYGLCDIFFVSSLTNNQSDDCKADFSRQDPFLHSVIALRKLTNILVFYGDFLYQTEVLELIKTEWIESNYRSVLCQLSEGKSHHYALNVSARFNITC